MSTVDETYIEDPGDLNEVLKDLFKGDNVEGTSDVWANISDANTADDQFAVTPVEEAIKNAEVVFETPRLRKRTRKQSTSSLTGGKKRRKTKLDDFDGDADAHNRHRQMNNLSVKRCREKKKKDHEALQAGFKQQEEDLKKAKAEIETLKATVMRLEGSEHCPPNVDSNKDLLAEVNSLKAILKEKDQEIESLQLERAYGFTEVERLEDTLRPFRHHDLEQTWASSSMSRDGEHANDSESPVNNEVLFNQVLNE